MKRRFRYIKYICRENDVHVEGACIENCYCKNKNRDIYWIDSYCLILESFKIFFAYLYSYSFSSSMVYNL